MWRRLEVYSPDLEGAAFPYSARLAKENGWSRAHAKRVIEEYKRFAFLSVASGHPVTPSLAVDEAWHLHLLYTEDYWNRFCGQVLGRPLHHCPSRGGDQEESKFQGWYELTLESYRRLFEADPPHDIWPGPLRPKRRSIVRRAWPILALVTAAVLIGLGCEGSGPSSSPFDMAGPEFLGFYFWLEVACLVFGLFLRNVLRTGGPDAPETISPLDPDSVAVLASGRSSAINSAIASLVQQGACTLDPGTASLEPVVDSIPNSGGLPAALFNWTKMPGPHPVSAARTVASHELDDIEDDLRNQGLVVPPDQARFVIWVPLLVSMVAPILGSAKIDVGLSRGRPVEFLVLACVASVALNLFVFARRPVRSRMGDALVGQLRRQNAHLRDIATTREQPTPSEFAMSTALFGVGILAAGSLGYLVPLLAPPVPRQGTGGGCSGNSPYNCSGGGGTSSCGGGGGSCSSGGGSGCGGCSSSS